MLLCENWEVFESECTSEFFFGGRGEAKIVIVYSLTLYNCVVLKQFKIV